MVIARRSRRVSAGGDVAEPRHAGRSGGLLFLAVLLFVTYLVVTAVAGLARFLLGGASLIVVVVLALNVLRRR